MMGTEKEELELLSNRDVLERFRNEVKKDKVATKKS